MKKIKVKKVDAFTDKPFTGNPAGLVLDADDLDEEQMQRIAREMNCSETAFVRDSDRADYGVRFFSPLREVDLCGHATVAAFYVMALEGMIKGDDGPVMVTQETKAGVLPVEILFGKGIVKKVMMTQAKADFRGVKVSREEMATALRISSDEISDRPIEAAYTGLWSLKVPVRSLQTMEGLSPDFEALLRLSKNEGTGDVHVFTTETVHKDSAAHSRCFAPFYGVNEDPVTGTASGSLGAYLVKNRIIEGASAPVSMTLEQGYEIGRSGKVFVEVYPDAATTIEKVKVGGQAVVVLEGEMRME